MSTFAESIRTGKMPTLGISVGLIGLLFAAALALPNLLRSRSAADRSLTRQQVFKTEQAFNANHGASEKGNPAVMSAGVDAAKGSATSPVDAAAERRIIRTSSLDMVVQHPAEVTEKITALAESLGGYLVSGNGGGESATAATLTIRVPAERFDQVRAQIRKLGLRVESERIDAQDVTRQYVDQDANIRNLRAEEAQYLAILKQANTVKDMLAVSEKLSRVRGQIEQQQAEFNALSKQIETVAIAISLRTEAEAQVFGLDWRPLYQLKLGLRDGVESVANYAAAMTAILFYLPALVLWVGTIGLGVWVGWRTVLWTGRKFGWNVDTAEAQK